jgi:ABC-type glycerol-3-phosphate transport system substrate-binding protein
MKTARMLAALAVAALLSAAPAQAQVVNLSKMSCKEFLTTGKDGITFIWAWLYGYYADQDADPIIDFGKLTAKGQALAEACQKSPDKDVISIAEDIYEK